MNPIASDYKFGYSNPPYYYAESQGGAAADDGYGYEPPSYYDSSLNYQQDLEWNEASDPAINIVAADPGYFTPVTSLQASFVGDPVTAVAYSETYSAIHLASAAKPMSTKRFNDHKASMLVTQSTDDGSVYSSVAGHPQASSSTLAAVYDALYGAAVSPSTTLAPASRASMTIPAHAYRPYYGAAAAASLTFDAASSSAKQYNIGIHTLLAHLPQAYVASVSPSGVRLHSHGGFQATDRHLEGMLCGATHPNSMATHLTVGGVAGCEQGQASGYNISKHNQNNLNNNHLLCMDIWQGFRTVASHDLNRNSKAGNNNDKIAVTALATSDTNNSLLAGCSDGQVRMFDASLRPLATIKSHVGGVTAVTVSDDGTLIATTGYGARARRTTNSPLYAFPDPMVLVYDVRYLGRGGISHAFAASRGGPRHVTFLPNVEGLSSNRLLVASGQGGGGMQIIDPFQEASDHSANFILPPLDRDAITSMCTADDGLALGTSSGMVLQYRLEGVHATSSLGKIQGGVFLPSNSMQASTSSGTKPAALSPGKTKTPLVAPSLVPPAPALSLGPELLQSHDSNMRVGADDRMRSIFSAYILSHDPSVSSMGNPSSKHLTSFGHLATNPLVAPCRLNVLPQFVAKGSHAVDFLHTIATTELGVDVLDDHRPDQVKERVDNHREPLPNANKLMHTSKLFPLAYEESLIRTKKMGKKGKKEGLLESNGEEIRIPDRYRLFLRQTHKTPASFNHSAYNETGFVPGWDYAATMPNAFVPPVIMLLYFIPEVRQIVSSSLMITQDRLQDEHSLLPELGFVMARIDNIARLAMLFPPSAGSSPSTTRVGAWAPTNFISCLSDLKEAEQLQILDGSPAAVDLPRRPEAFYRFLLHHVNKETSTGMPRDRLEDSVGATFLSVNQYINGSDPPTQTSSRLMTIDLCYDNFLNANRKNDSLPTFADVLQKTLFRETRLRAWSSGSKAYETITQRKVMTTLPKILSLSCACAGRDSEQGLSLWRTVADHGHFLPEWIEIELTESGAVIVRELLKNEQTGVETWSETKSNENLPISISEILVNFKREATIRKQRYRLDIVLSAVRDDLDSSNAEIMELIGDGPLAHHVVHARIPKGREIQIFEKQCTALEELLDLNHRSNLAMLSAPTCEDQLKLRLKAAQARLADLQAQEPKDDWVAINGFIVSKTNVDDARAFHIKFKEPSLIIFRAMDETDSLPSSEPTMDHSLVPMEVMHTFSLSNGSPSLLFTNQWTLPPPGDLLAFDAEFVSVGDEESILTDKGSKLVVREMRYAVARISVIHCRTGAVVLDDYVLPREPIVDYLTRFSGIVAKDLDPKYSSHHLISTRAAYLKLRYLMERGCIFIGHGLQMDFWTLNLTIPSHQIIDTVEIYHKPAQRYVSLRFATNFVLKRDMQMDVHDSIEDALAAYQLYETAVELKAKGEFDKLLDDLYEFGFKNDWKLGVDDTEL
ncbi:hypothetical protein MPSEU_000999600 [Mayamaea pseudoterrestris]|nr:hypothetical protein MPSEU_000999600 [Mayamaea pseudoterrestris]